MYQLPAKPLEVGQAWHCFVAERGKKPVVIVAAERVQAASVVLGIAQLEALDRCGKRRIMDQSSGYALPPGFGEMQVCEP